MRTVKAIIEDAGGPGKIASAIGKRGSPAVSVKGVYNWKRIGIPEKHWPLMERLCEASAEELHKANRRLRAAVRPSQAAAA